MKKTNYALLSYIRKFELVFTRNNFDVFSKHHCSDHTIKLTLRTKLEFSKIYLLFPAEQIELNVFFAKNLYTDQIYLSKSPIAIPVFLIKKKDNLLQLVQDYRTLNFIMIKSPSFLSLFYSSAVPSFFYKTEYLLEL